MIRFVSHTGAYKWPDIIAGERFDPDTAPERFRSGVDGWVVQTLLRCGPELAEMTGQPPDFSSRFSAGDICVAHRDDLNHFRAFAPGSTLVGIRADRPPLYVAEHVVIQNSDIEDAGREFFIPFWPTPGLRPRDTSRGDTLSRLAYLGRLGTAPRWYFDPDFHAALARENVEFVIEEHQWYDYSSIDAIIAMRDEAPTMLARKPASKLYNAWLAGTPALLGPEPAYHAIRASALDFMSVANADDVLSAVRRLRNRPDLYRAMIENGRTRSLDYNVDAIRRRWLAYFADVVLPAHDRRTRAGQFSVRARLDFALALVRQKAASKRFKFETRREILEGTG